MIQNDHAQPAINAVYNPFYKNGENQAPIYEQPRPTGENHAAANYGEGPSYALSNQSYHQPTQAMGPPHHYQPASGSVNANSPQDQIYDQNLRNDQYPNNYGDVNSNNSYYEPPRTMENYQVQAPPFEENSQGQQSFTMGHFNSSVRASDTIPTNKDSTQGQDEILRQQEQKKREEAAQKIIHNYADLSEHQEYWKVFRKYIYLCYFSTLCHFSVL